MWLVIIEMFDSGASIGPSETVYLDSFSGGGELEIARKGLDSLRITRRSRSSLPETHTIDLTRDIVRLDYLMPTGADVTRRWNASVTRKSLFAHEPLEYEPLEYSFQSEQNTLRFQRLVTGYMPHKRFKTLRGTALERDVNPFKPAAEIRFDGEGQLWEVAPLPPLPPLPLANTPTPVATASNMESTTSKRWSPSSTTISRRNAIIGELAVAATTAKPPPLLVVFGKPRADDPSFHIIRVDGEGS